MWSFQFKVLCVCVCVCVCVVQGLHLEPLHQSFLCVCVCVRVFWNRVSQKYLPGLASNHNPPDLCLLSSQDYRHKPLAPSQNIFKFVLWFIFWPVSYLQMCWLVSKYVWISQIFFCVDFWFNSVVAEEHILYDFNPFQCIGAYLMA
jgi:hypothetical protein